MLPPRTSLDPNGYYAWLGLDPAAPQATIAVAYRAKARLFHPDVPKTGNAAAFVAVKQAYDVLSHPESRQEYDRTAKEQSIKPEATVVRPACYRPVSDLVHPLPLSGLTIAILAGLAAFLCLSVYETARHLMMASAPVASAAIQPNAATVEPLSPSEHRTVLYGPAPIRLAGTPNFYVVPAGSPAVLWRLDSNHNTLVPLRQLPPFSVVQAIRVIRQTGMLEVLVNDRGNGFVDADHLMPGDVRAAQTAYCSYNSGPAPFNGELLQQRGSGVGTLSLENQAVQPAVVKLRDRAGAVMVAIFLGPGGRAELAGLPEGPYRPEFAIGELWSRACNSFAAGMRARRMDADVTLADAPHIVVTSDSGGPAASDISDQMFQQD